MVVVVAVSVVAPLLLLVVVLIKCLGCLRKKEGFKTFENEESRMEARINPGFAMGQDVDDRDPSLSTTIQIEPLPELLTESTPRKPKIACVEKTKQEAAFKLVVINNPHPFPRRQLTYLKEIGTGWFGQVLESDAEHITTGIPLSRVMAKVLRDDASNSEKKLFLEDVVPYRELEHSNVLRLLGQCTESAPYLMILEYAQMGDLKTCVKKLKDRSDVMTQNYQVVKFAIDAASGLACLHRHGYIHQDFAARNCVVMADYTVKIGDYGISEDVFKDDYFVSGKESLPIRWMAPETLSQQSGSWQTAVITRESNIWSFGVLLWEVLMFGKQPYWNMSDDQVLQAVIADRMVKLPEPDVTIQFKDRIVEVMLFCWLNPGERPSIEDAHGLLQRLYEIVAGDQVKAENFEKKWNQMIPHEARIVSAKPEPKQQKRPASASFDNNFVKEPKPEPQQAVADQFVKPGDLVSVKVEDMSTSVVNGDHIAVNMQPSLAGNLAQLPTPSRHTLPAHMTSTPIMDLAPTPTEPDVSQKQKSGSGSRTSRKIEDEFSFAQAASTKSKSGSIASPLSSEEKAPDVLIDVPQEDTAAVRQGVLSKEKDVPVPDQFDLLEGKPAVSATQPPSSVDVLEAAGAPVQDVKNEPNTQEGNKQEQASVNNKDPFADLFGQGEFADQIKPVSSQPDSSAELLPSNGNQSLFNESSPKSDAESPVTGIDEPDAKAGPVGKQTASSDTRTDTDVAPQNFLSNDIDLVSSHNFQAESIIPSTFHPSEKSAGEPVSKGENGKPSDLALDNGTSGYETPADQSVKSDSIEENTSGAESSSDSAVCVSSPELADAPSSFDGAAPSDEKVGTCVEYVSDDESKSSSSESDSSSDSSNSGSSYVCEESRRHIQVTDLDADDDDSDNLDEHQDYISDEVTDSDEDLDLRLASELYLSKGVSSPRVFERPPLETIPEDVMPSPSDTSSIDLKFDAHFDDVFASQDNFEWDDFMGESIVGRDRTSNTPKASFDMSDWLMDGDSLSYRSSGSIQSPLDRVSPDVLGTSDPSIRLSTASSSEVKRQRGRTSRSYVSDLITNRSIHDSFTNTKNTRTPFYSLFDNVDMDSDSDSNLSPDSNKPESRLIETAPAGLHDKVEDLASGSRTDDSLFIQQPSLGPTDVTFSVETSLSSAPVSEADVTSQKLLREKQTEESPDPSDNFKGLGGIDQGKGNIIEQGQPKKKAVPENLESAFEELASQHGIDLFGSGEVSNISDNQYNEFSFDSLGKSNEVNLFDDFLSPDTNDVLDKSEVPSVAAFFTGSDIPEIPVAHKAVDAAPVIPLEIESFSKETDISQTALRIDFVTPEADSSSSIPTDKSKSDANESEFIDINRDPNEIDSDGDPVQSYALTQPDITDKSGSDESDNTQPFTDPESITVSFSDVDATEVHSFPETLRVNVPQIPSIRESPADALTVDIAGSPEVSKTFSQENMTDTLTQLGDSHINIDVPSIHTKASEILQGSYEAPPDCQDVEASPTYGSSVSDERVVSMEDAEIASIPVLGSDSEVGKIHHSDMLHEDSQTSPDVEQHPADKPDDSGSEPTALFNQNREDDSAFEMSVKQDGSDINFEESFSFTVEPHYSPQGNYESEDNTSFDMVGTASDVEIITESPTHSIDELNESEIVVVSEPDIVPSVSPPNMSSSVEIGHPSMDAAQDFMPYAGPTATPDLLPANTDSSDVATGDRGAHDDAGISHESLVVMDTDKDDDTLSTLEEQSAESKSNDFTGFEQIQVPGDLPFVPNSHQLTDTDKIIDEPPQPQDQSIGVNTSQQIPSEDAGFTDLEGFDRIPVPDDLPSVSDSMQFTSFTDLKSQSDISIETRESITEVKASPDITSNVINVFGQQFIPGMDTFEEKTSEQTDAPDFMSHVTENDALDEIAEKDKILADSLKTEDAAVDSESVNFAENVMNVNAPGSSGYVAADAGHPDADVPSKPVKTVDSDGALTETKCESPELMSPQIEENINLDKGCSDQLSSSDQGSWPSDASEAGSDQSITDFEDLGVTTPEQAEVSQTGDAGTVSTDSLLDGFVEISSSPVGGGISEAEANSDSKFPDTGQDGETVDGTGDGFLLLSGSEEEKQAKLFNDGSNEGNVGQGIIDFPDSSLTDSQESAAFLDLSSSQEGLVMDNEESGMSETSVLNRVSTVADINTGRDQAAQEITSEDIVSLSPTGDNMETSHPFNTSTPVNNETVGPNDLISTSGSDFEIQNEITSQNQMKGDLSPSNEASVIMDIDESAAVLPVMTKQTEDSDPSENIVSNLGASNVFPSVELEPTTIGQPTPDDENSTFTFVETEHTEGSDPFALTSSENNVPKLEASDAFPSVETGQTTNSDPFGLPTPGENTHSNLVASDVFPLVEPAPTTDSDPFGLTSSENTVPKLKASDVFPSVETEQTADSDPFGLATTSGEVNLGASDMLSSVEPEPRTDSDPSSPSSENSVPMLEAKDAFASLETGQTTDSDPFGLTSSGNTVPKLEASDIFHSETEQTADSDPFSLATPTRENTETNLGASDMLSSVETEQTADSDPFGLTSSENTVPKLEASDAFTSVETEQTADSDPFGLTSSENTVQKLEASDALTPVETGQTADSDPFGLTSNENTVPKLETSDAFPSVETEQTADSDPFGLKSSENTVPKLEASDAFTSVETEQTADSDPFVLQSSENTVPKLEASDPFTSVETGQTADSDPFGLTSSENTAPKLEASDPFTSVETGQTADSDPFGLTSSENTVPKLEASDAFTPVETGQTADSDPFDLTSSENTVPKLEASDAFTLVETGQTADSDPFGLTSNENTVPKLQASDVFPSVETEQTADSDPFGLTSSENTVPKLETSDVFSVETGQTADSDPFGLTSSENTVPKLEASDAFTSVETGQTADSDPFGLTSSENTVPKLETSDAFPSVETEQTADSDPFGLTSSENNVPKLEASDAFTSVETEQTADSDPFGLPSSENTVPKLEASDAFTPVETGQTADSDPFGLTSSENTVPKLEASDAFTPVETEQTADSDSFGLGTTSGEANLGASDMLSSVEPEPRTDSDPSSPSSENSVPMLEAKDAFASLETGQTTDSDPFGLTSSGNTVPKLEASDIFHSETEQTADSDPFSLATPTRENTETNLGASDMLSSVETEQTADSDPFGLTSSENTVPKLEASDAFTSVETEQTADSDPFGLPSSENTVPKLEASDAFTPVETGQTADSDPFGLTSNENTVPKLETSDAFPSVETEQTADSDPFGLTSNENTVPKLGASDAFTSVETGQTADSDPFGLTSSENTVPKLEASDVFPSVETEQTADSDPFGLTSSENTVPKLEASDVFPSVETEQTADSDPFGLTSSGNTVPKLEASDVFPSVGTGQTADSDPFGLTSSENTVPKLQASDVFSVETGQTAESDPFGLPSSENTVPKLQASDVFSVETGQTAESDPFGLPSSENTVPKLEASDAFTPVETGQTADSDPFGLTSNENTVPKLETSDAFPSVETEQTADSDPFGLTSSENTVPKLEASDAFTSVETGQTADSDPFSLTSSENTVPKLEASDAFTPIETGQTADSDPFGLPSSENTVPKLEASDVFSVETGETADSDPFGLTSSENTVPKLEASDLFPSVETEQTADSDPFGLTSSENTVQKLEESDPFTLVETGQTADSDPFGLPSSENTVPKLEASDAFPSVETEQTADSDPFGLTSSENTVPKLEASDVFPSVETEQTADSDPFGLTSSENTVPKLEASDVFPSVETEQTADSDPFGLTSSGNTVPKLEASDVFPSVGTEQTADSDPFGLTSSENTVPKLETSDAFTSVETEQTEDSDPFGLTSSENTVPKLEASDAFPSVETEQTADSDPFGLTSSENTVPKLEASDAFTPIETGQTADSDPFGLTSSENTVPKLEASDAFTSVETGQTADSDPFGLTSSENTVQKLETSDAFTPIETGQTADSDPFGLTSSENTVPKLEASDAFTSVETGQTADSDPFGLPSSENTVPKLEASDPFTSVETGQTADSDPFGLTSSENTAPKLEASDPFTSVETGQTADSDPFGLTSSENAVQKLEESDAFTLVETGQTADSDPFGLTSSENTVPKLEASDPFTSVETEQTAESDPFGLTSSENTVPKLEASDVFPSVETGQTADSDPFGLTSSENTVPKLEASDAFTPVETGQTADSDPFGLTSNENTIPKLEASDVFSVETEQTTDSDPFGLTSSENTVPKLEASDAFTSVETEQTEDSDPFGLTSSENTVPKLQASDAFTLVETGQTADSDPFGLTSSENTVPKLEASDPSASVDAGQTADSDPFGLATPTGENTLTDPVALDSHSVLIGQEVDSDPFGSASSQNNTLTSSSEHIFSADISQVAESNPFAMTNPFQNDTVPNLSAFPPLETAQTTDSDSFVLISQVESSELETGDMFGVSAGSNIESVSTQNPMTDSGMLLDFVQSGSEAPSQTNSGTSADIFGSSLDFTSPSSAQDSSQSAADTKESDQSALLDMFEKPPTQNVEPQSSDTSSLVDLF